MATEIISTYQAALMGLVEGITEFLPISSTGHLILLDRFLGLRGSGAWTPEQQDAIDAFEIVIQSGAIIAVAYAYVGRIREMVQGISHPESQGRKLLLNLIAAFIPAMVIGFVLHKMIKTYLQQEWPTVAALAMGGVVMICWERSQAAKDRRLNGKSIDQLSVRDSVKIGLLQCVAMWPGTSRSMMTILGGQWVGLSPVAAAEFSFLLGLPTLLAATSFKILKDGNHLVEHVGFDAMAVGLIVAAIFAFISVKALLAWLTKHGLAPFGWYRLVLAGVVTYLIW